MVEGGVVCGACPHACRLAEGRRGLCRARVGCGAQVVCESYGRVTAAALDPVEKKPLARFRPGAKVLSLGSYGCNMRCPFCQNAEIACAGPQDAPWRELSPEGAVALAAHLGDRGCVGLAFTYNEPLIGYEYVRDAGALAHEAGLVNVLVSNGMANEEALCELDGLVDAANIDLKAFTQDFYAAAGGELGAVKRTIERLAEDQRCHLEVTTLVVPGLNDAPEEIDAAASWLASLDPAIPYHLTRFFPCHRMLDRPATPLATLRRLAEVARRRLDEVILGNC